MSPPRLLIIDDEEDLCDLIKELAEDRGLEVKTIHDGSQLEGAIKEFTPDGIMMDLMMPNTDGVELLRTMSGHTKGAKIVLMSGSDSRVLNSARRLGHAHGLDVIGILEKPIEVAQIRATLDQLFSGKPVVASASETPPQPNDLAMAIASGQIVLHYQPIVDLNTNKPVAVEALARWAHPQRDVVPPLEFVAQAAEDGLLHQLTHHVLDQACRQQKAWLEKGVNLSMYVNLSAALLTDASLPDHVFALCDQYQIPQGSLIFEIPEVEAMKEAERTLDVMNRLHLRKIGFVIDEFGTGRSSIRDLQRMPLLGLKMDRSFVTGLPSSQESTVVAQSIINLAHSLHITASAVGVESEEARAWLAKSGCDLGQGHVFSEALTGADVEAWISGKV